MDAVAASAYLPVGELGRGGVAEARELGQRDGDGATVDEIDGKGVGCELDRRDSLVGVHVSVLHSLAP